MTEIEFNQTGDFSGCYRMGVSMILKENDLPDDIIQSLGEVS